MSSELSIKGLKQSLEPTLALTQKYIRFLYFIFFISICIFLVFQINHYAGVEPSDQEINDKLETVQRPHIDQDSIRKIQQLQDQNIEVQSLFQQARDNPFSE